MLMEKTMSRMEHEATDGHIEDVEDWGDIGRVDTSEEEEEDFDKASSTVVAETAATPLLPSRTSILAPISEGSRESTASVAVADAATASMPISSAVPEALASAQWNKAPEFETLSPPAAAKKKVKLRTSLRNHGRGSLQKSPRGSVSSGASMEQQPSKASWVSNAKAKKVVLSCQQ